MLTTGDNVTAVAKYYVASGQYTSRELREKITFFMQQGGEEVWTSAPTWWREDTQNVSLLANASLVTLPLNFSQFGENGNVYVLNAKRPPLIFTDPSILAGFINQNSTSQTYPLRYSLHSRVAASWDSGGGTPKMKVWPPPAGNTTLEVSRYVARAPYLVDMPTAPNATVGASGNVDIGIHQWKVAFANADDTILTEGGIPTPQKTLSIASQVALTDIPVSPAWTVTRKHIYRTEADGSEFLFLATIDNQVTTYTDNIADSGLGAEAPFPQQAVGTGMEQFPEDWQRSLMYQYAKAAIANAEGDPRERAWGEDWQKRVAGMWAELKQGQNIARFTPRYGQRVGPGYSIYNRLGNI